MQELLPLFFFLAVFRPVEGHAIDISRRGFLLGTVATTAAAQLPLSAVTPPVEAGLPPLPPGYFEKRFELFFHGHSKQADMFLSYEADHDLINYTGAKRMAEEKHEFERTKMHSSLDMARFEDPAPNPEYDAKINVHSSR